MAMENTGIETVTSTMGVSRTGWKGILFNLCFILYYYLVYQLVVSETHTVESYGEKSPMLFSTTLALIVLISLIAEPFAIGYKMGYENYNVKGPALRVPGFFLFVIGFSRFVVRVLFFIAALGSLGLDFENGGFGAGCVATFVFVGELVFVMSLTDKSFIGRIKPTLRKALFTRFILLNMLVLFTYLFKTSADEILSGDGKSLNYKVWIGLLLFVFLYLPNTMVQFYGDWRAAKTITQKCLYLLSLCVAFVSILFFY